MATVDPKLPRIVARMPEVRTEVRALADKVAARADAAFAAHDRPGGHKITRTNGKVDAFVNLEGPVPHIVEYGRSGYTTASGAKVGAMVGLHFLTKAMDSA